MKGKRKQTWWSITCILRHTSHVTWLLISCNCTHLMWYLPDKGTHCPSVPGTEEFPGNAGLLPETGIVPGKPRHLIIVIAPETQRSGFKLRLNFLWPWVKYYLGSSSIKLEWKYLLHRIFKKGLMRKPPSSDLACRGLGQHEFFFLTSFSNTTRT